MSAAGTAAPSRCSNDSAGARRSAASFAAIGHRLVANRLSTNAETDTDAGKMARRHDKIKPDATGAQWSGTEPLRGSPVFRAMEEERRLRADIARYRRTLRIVFDADVARRIEEMIKRAEDRLREIERLP